MHRQDKLARIAGFSIPSLVALALIPTMGSCGWWSSSDYADSEAFAAQAVPAVLGRRPYSHEEVQALATLASVNGPAAVLDVLYEEDDFGDYWSLVFADQLEVDRVGSTAQNPLCYGPPLVPESLYPQLAVHVAESDPTEEFCVTKTIIIANPWPVITMYGEVAFEEMTDVPAAQAIADWEAANPEKEPPQYVEHELNLEYAPVDLASVSGVDTVQAEAEVAAFDEAQLGAVSEVRFDDLLEPAEYGIMEAQSPYEALIDTETPWFNDYRRWWRVFEYEVCYPFNMTDLLAASIEEERMDALYRGYMAPLATWHTVFGVASTKFQMTYLERDPACMSCHTTTYSTTDGIVRNDDWDRFAPAVRLDLEQGAFSYEDSGSTYQHRGMGGTDVTVKVRNFWDTSNQVVTGGIRPFGFDDTCVTSSSYDGFQASRTSGSPSAGFGINQSGTAGVFDLMNQLRDGKTHLPFASYGPAPDTIGGNVAAGDTLYNTDCVGCHSAGSTTAPNDLTIHTANMTPERIYDVVMNGSPAGLMPAGMYSDAEARNVAAYLTSLSSHNTPMVYDLGEISFAKLVSQSIVNQTFDEVAGYSLILEHGFPRNPDVGFALGWSSLVLDANNWSLKKLLSQVLLSDHMNRNAPAESVAGAYDLPEIVFPWSMKAPSAPSINGSDANGQGDIVHRWGVDNLLLQVGHALGWTEPQVYNDTFNYPSESFRRDIGGYYTANDPGFHEPTLGAMLDWEAGLGDCNKPTGVTSDYIDTLVDPVHGLSIEEAMLALKDRLVSDPQWWPAVGAVDEYAIAQGLLNGTSMSDAANTDELAIRDYCGTLLRSPQFLLAGLPPWQAGTNPAPLTGVPCVDTYCTETEYCEHYRDVAGDLGYDDTYACP